MDEITVDLDVLGRADLMSFLRRECEERNVTIVYATHIFDGLEQFATHVAFVAGGRLRFCEPLDAIDGLKSREPGSLLDTVQVWLRQEAEAKRKEAETLREEAAALEMAAQETIAALEAKREAVRAAATGLKTGTQGGDVVQDASTRWAARAPQPLKS